MRKILLVLVMLAAGTVVSAQTAPGPGQAPAAGAAGGADAAASGGEAASGEASGAEAPGGDASGQSDGAAADAAGSAADDAASGEASVLSELLSVLKDEAARETLIQELEAAVSAPGAEPSAGAEGSGGSLADLSVDPDEAVRSAGRRIAELTQGGVARVVGTANDLYAQILEMPQTLDRLMQAVDPQVVIAAVKDLLLVIVVTVGTFVALRLAEMRLDRVLSRRAARSGWFGTAGMALLSAIVSVLVVLVAWAAGYLLTLHLNQGFGVTQLRQTYYLNAFLSVGMAKTAGRIILSPRFPELRLITLANDSAWAIWSWFNFVAMLLGYGILLAVPIANFSAGIFAGAALEMAISAIAIVYTIYRVLRARRAVARWLNPMTETIEDQDVRTPLLAHLAGLWHWPVLVYLVVLLVLVIARPGNVLLPLLKASGMIVAVLVGGLMVTNLLQRSARHGVRLGPYIRHRLPMLEERVNSLLPNILFVVRMIVTVVVIAIALDIVGAWNIDGWLTSERGRSLISKYSGVLVILLIASLIWLALSSWVEYRLNPLVGKAPTPREITLLTLMKNAVTIALMILTGMFVLSQIGLNIAPLLASAGVLGLAIGFGAQKMVQDIITGIFIQFENAMNVGDVVTVGGVSGVVEKLTVRSVSLRDLEGIYHIIPFSSVDMVSNYMRDFSFYLVDMGVAYREDMAEAKKAMFDAFDRLREDEEQKDFVLGDLEWFGLDSFGDSAIVLRARIKTLPGKQWGVGRAYNLLVKELFDERGIEIPFPHQTIYFGENRDGSAPPLHIKPEPADVVTTAEDDDADRPDASKVAKEPPRPTQDGPSDDAPDGEGEAR